MIATNSMVRVVIESNAAKSRALKVVSVKPKALSMPPKYNCGRKTKSAM
jgi:hypothetical protein